MSIRYFDDVYIFLKLSINAEECLLKTLEISHLKDKKITVIIAEREYNEPFWILESHPTATTHMLKSLFKPSIAFYKFLESIIEKTNPDFATEELGMRSQNEFYEDNILAKIFQNNKITFVPVDIDGNAKAYLTANMDKKRN